MLLPVVQSPICAAVVELVDTLDSKSDVLIGRAGSSPARGTTMNRKLPVEGSFS